MAIVTAQLLPENASMVGTVYPDYTISQGTNFPVSSLHYTNGVNQQAIWKGRAVNYGSGNLTLDIIWYSQTILTGNVVFLAQVAAVTPETDTQDVETKVMGTSSSVTDAHLGTTAKRLHRATITLTDTNSLAADDIIFILLQRNGTNGSDTIAENISVTNITISYSDV